LDESYSRELPKDIREYTDFGGGKLMISWREINDRSPITVKGHERRLLSHALKIIHHPRSSPKTTKINTEGLLIRLFHIPGSPAFHIPDIPDAIAISMAEEAASAEPDSSRQNFLMESILFPSHTEFNHPMVGRQGILPRRLIQ
jgi:hypothetical protein